jgi:hypothetical protein
MKDTPTYPDARKMLPPEFHPILDEFLADYRFAALKHHGREWASPRVLAELILMGWRYSGSEHPTKSVGTHRKSKNRK